MKYKRGIMSLLVFSMLITLLLPGSVMAAEKDEVIAVPIIVKTGEDTPDDTTFTIIVKERDSKKTRNTLKITAKEIKAGEKLQVEFGPYEEAGDYFYTVYEVEGNTKGVTYSESEYVVRVTVSDQYDKDGNYVGLVPAAFAWYKKDAEEMKESDKRKIVFTNTYKKPHKDTKKTKSVKTGDNSNIYFWTVLAVIAAAACIMLLFADQKRRRSKK